MAEFRPHIFWLCGLSGAGKSTLATALSANLRARSIPVLALDGDRVRMGICAGLGFTALDRTENLRRAAEVAKLGWESGLCIVASFITPLETNRQMVLDILGTTRCSLIFADAPLTICGQRDVKGLYARAAEGKIPQMTGISSGFENPSAPDLVLRTAEESPATSAGRLWEFALKRIS